MFRGNPQHTGRSPYVGSSANSTKWKFATGGAIYSSPSIGADGTVYVGSSDGNVYAIDPDGTERWSFPTGYDGVGSSPAVGNDGTIYIGGSYDSLFALNPNGSLKWKFITQAGVESSPVIGTDGTIYFGSYDDFLYALNPDGSLRWKFQTGDSIYSSPAIGPDGTVYVGTMVSDQRLYAINSDGSLKWVFPPFGNGTYGPTISSPSVGSDGTVYVAFGYAGFLLALNQNGTVKWKSGTYGGGNIFSSTAIGLDGAVYVGNQNDSLTALTPDGSPRWVFTTHGYVVSSPTIDAGGSIYFGSYDGRVYALDSSGKLKWEFATGGEVASSPAMGTDGTIYVGSSNGWLYAIGSPGSTLSTTIATTAGAPNASASLCNGTSPGFAYVKNADLMLGGNQFRFIGGNEPNLLAEYLGLPFVPDAQPPSPEKVMADAASNGICVVKFSMEAGAQFTGGGLVGTGNSPTNGDGAQTFKLFWQTYNSDPAHSAYFHALDNLVLDAKKYGLHIIPILSISFMGWGYLGNDTDFYKVNGTANQIWKGFVASVVSRYRNESTILWWDIGDEANNEVGVAPGQFPQQFQDQAYSRPISELVQWANDTRNYIKSIDPNHLVECDWNLPWDGFFQIYGNSAPQMIRSEYYGMTVFRELESTSDIVAIHTYDTDVKGVLSQVIYNSTDYQTIVSEFVQHYAQYSHDVLHEPFQVGEFDATTWANYWLGLGYSPNPYIQWFLQDLVKNHVDGALIWPFEDGSDFYHVSPQETPEVFGWLRTYSGLLAATNIQTNTTSTTSISATTSSTITSTAQVTTSSISATSPTTSTTRQTTTGGGGIPEFPYQLVVVTILTFLVVASYLLTKRGRPPAASGSR